MKTTIDPKTSPEPAELLASDGWYIHEYEVNATSTVKLACLPVPPRPLTLYIHIMVYHKISWWLLIKKPPKVSGNAITYHKILWHFSEKVSSTIKSISFVSVKG